MNKDQSATFSLVLVLVLIVVLTVGAGRFFSVILNDILTYHPTQLDLNPIPAVNSAIRGSVPGAAGAQWLATYTASILAGKTPAEASANADAATAP